MTMNTGAIFDVPTLVNYMSAFSTSVKLIIIVLTPVHLGLSRTLRERCPNMGKYRPEKLRIWTLFTQWNVL